jgi:deoxyribose-phosphate aldolase
MNAPKQSDAEIAARALACLDLTDLTDSCEAAGIETLCARAQTPHGPVAAVCVWPRFAPLAKERLGRTRIKVATVINFPYGRDLIAPARHDAEQAVSDGADELDLVMPYRAFAEGRADVAAKLIDAVRRVAGGRTLKVILETGMLREPSLIRRAADLAIAEGADFLKTSTGKVEVNATPEAAEILLDAIAAGGRSVGFKAAGGVKTLADARLYLEMADRMMGKGWARPETFRFGASGLLAALMETLGPVDEAAPAPDPAPTADY